MKEPKYPRGTTPYDDWIEWARENKKRADRLLAAIKKFERVYNSPDNNNAIWVEVRMAALDYEDRRG